MTNPDPSPNSSASGRSGTGEVAPSDIRVVPGDILAGKFRVERVLGAGGMGVVVEARHVDLDDRVAIKLLLPAALERPDVVARFRREARAAVKIKSEHIARVIDVGSLEDGAPYIVMEYLEGYDLSKPTRNQGRLPIPTVVDYLLQAAEAIAEAHAMGIVHRDIKPPNLFLTHRPDGSPCVKVLDFGISKVVGTLDAGQAGQSAEVTEATLTHTTVVLGSPRYMAPEQISKPKSVDARADIWGMGTTFYRLVTGYPPFEGSTLPEIFAAILMTPDGPRPIHDHVPDAPKELDPVIRRCMRIKPEERWQNLGELAKALAPFGTDSAKRSAERIVGTLESAGISTTSKLPPLPLGSASPASSSGASLSNTVETEADALIAASRAGRKKIVSIVAAIASILIVGLIVLFLMSGRSPSVPPPQPAASGASTSSAALPLPSATLAVPATAAVSAAAEPSASAPALPTSPHKGPSKAPTTKTKKADEGDGEELFDQRN